MKGRESFPNDGAEEPPTQYMYHQLLSLAPLLCVSTKINTMAQGGPPTSTTGGAQPPLTLWSAADRGETEVVRHLLGSGGRDVNARNCLGCTPLLYACGSGHVETVVLGPII